MKRTYGRNVWIYLCILVLVLMLPLAALADDISNKLDGTVDATAEDMPLNIGVNGTTQLYVVPTDGDGKPGCNFQGHETLVVSIESSAPSVATVSPSSVTFGSCDDIIGLTITPLSQGSATISFSQFSNNTGDSFNFLPATFRVVVAPPPPSNTAPKVSVTGVTVNASYEPGSVPVAMCEVEDAEDGSSSFAATLGSVTGPLAPYGFGAQEASCSYIDKGGLKVSASVTYFIVDLTAPIVSCGTTDGVWHVSNVSIACTASDGGSGLADPAFSSFFLSTNLSADSETDNALTGILVVADRAGNATQAGPISGNKIDMKAPTVSCGTADDVWHAGNVSIQCTASDGGSGLADMYKAFALSTSVAGGDETDNALTTSGSVLDNVGNATQAGPISGNKIDMKAPTVSCGTADDVWHAGNVSIQCTASDGGSGLADMYKAFALSTSVAGGDETDNALTTSGSVLDNVGNATQAGPISGNKIDMKAPTVSCGTADDVWHAGNVSIQCTASDGGSGLADMYKAFALSTSVAGGDETDNALTTSGSVLDNVGNATQAGPISGNKIDMKAPTISIAAPTSVNYVLNQQIAASYTCADGGSGIATCAGSATNGFNIDTASPGAKVFAVSASDSAGNSSNKSVSYSVVYATSGTCLGSPGHTILQPINADGSSVFKKGSTVPAKFRVCDFNGNSIGTGVVTSFKLVRTSTAPAATINEPVDSTTPDTAFRWDISAQQWIYNINTKSLTAGVSYTYDILLSDGSKISFTFSLK